MALLRTVERDVRGALVPSTTGAKTHAWARWREFCGLLEISEALDGYSHVEKQRVCAAFVAHTRRRRFRGGSNKNIAEKYVRKIIGNVGEALSVRGDESTGSNPFRGPDGKLIRSVHLMLRSYKLSDPPVKRQQPLSPRGLRHILLNAGSPREVFVAHLLTGAFFLACRSCEYVTSPGKPRTQVLLASDIRFFRIHGGCVKWVDLGARKMDAVQVRFRMQKNLSSEDVVTQHASGDELCPVASWRHVCRCLLQMHGSLEGVAVNEYVGQGGRITYAEIDAIIKAAMNFLLKGTDALSGADFGTHSVRCGAALAMYLSGTPIVDIMLQGRWSSDAFLVYIKRQVMELSVGISSNMVKNNDFTILPSRPHSAPRHRTKSSLARRSSQQRDLTTSPRLHLSH